MEYGFLPIPLLGLIVWKSIQISHNKIMEFLMYDNVGRFVSFIIYKIFLAQFFALG